MLAQREGLSSGSNRQAAPTDRIKQGLLPKQSDPPIREAGRMPQEIVDRRRASRRFRWQRVATRRVLGACGKPEVLQFRQVGRDRVRAPAASEQYRFILGRGKRRGCSGELRSERQDSAPVGNLALGASFLTGSVG